MHRLLLSILLVCMGFSSKSQTIERAFYGGLVYKTSGLGILYQNKFDQQKKFGKQFDLELSTYRHSRETKTFNSDVNNPTPFVFGKVNKVALLKAQYSVSSKISQFSDAQRIGIDVICGAGVSVGFLKPVYINLIYPDPSGYETVVSEKYNPSKHTDKTRIAGYSDSRVGLNEIDSKIGFSASAGIGFTWGYFTNFPKRLETGFYLEYFKNGLPVMAFVKNKSIQNGIYLKLFIGKRLTKN
ncbi:MAG: hypothetical protein ACKVQB_08640 [Bacteroidia bacterium]